MPTDVDESLVRNLTNLDDEKILTDSDLTELAEQAQKHVENDSDLQDSSQSKKNEAGVLWTCRLVAMKLRGASAVKSDDNLTLEEPKHYKNEYEDLKNDEDIPGSGIASRVGN